MFGHYSNHCQLVRLVLHSYRVLAEHRLQQGLQVVATPERRTTGDYIWNA